ncbi:uncharacterized protein AB9W97_018310 isoform 2-T2 [Spinachia spinachia]
MDDRAPAVHAPFRASSCFTQREKAPPRVGRSHCAPCVSPAGLEHRVLCVGGDKMTAKHRRGKGNSKHEDGWSRGDVAEPESRAGGNNPALLSVLFLLIAIGGAGGAWFCFQQQQTLTHLTDNLTGMQMKIVRLQSSHEEMRQSSSEHVPESLETRLHALEDSYVLAQKQVGMALATAEQLKTSELPSRVLSLHAEMNARLAEMQQATVSLEQLSQLQSVLEGRSEEFQGVRLQVDGLATLSAELSRKVEVLAVSAGEAESKLEEGGGQVAALSAGLEGQAAEVLRLKWQLDAYQAQLEAGAREMAAVRELLEGEASQRLQQAGVEEKLNTLVRQAEEETEEEAAASKKEEAAAPEEEEAAASKKEEAAAPEEEEAAAPEEEEAAAPEEEEAAAPEEEEATAAGEEEATAAEEEEAAAPEEEDAAAPEEEDAAAPEEEEAAAPEEEDAAAPEEEDAAAPEEEEAAAPEEEEAAAPEEEEAAAPEEEEAAAPEEEDAAAPEEEDAAAPEEEEAAAPEEEDAAAPEEEEAAAPEEEEAAAPEEEEAIAAEEKEAEEAFPPDGKLETSHPEEEAGEGEKEAAQDEAPVERGDSVTEGSAPVEEVQSEEEPEEENQEADEETEEAEGEMLSEGETRPGGEEEQHHLAAEEEPFGRDALPEDE